jgi:hypothetical protein
MGAPAYPPPPQSTAASRILKVYGFIEPLDAYKLKDSERVEIESDMHQEFNKIAPVTYCKFIRPDDVRLGAECGAIFLEFADANAARTAKMAMTGKRYDNRDILMIEVPEEVFYKEITQQNS